MCTVESSLDLELLHHSQEYLLVSFQCHIDVGLTLVNDQISTIGISGGTFNEDYRRWTVYNRDVFYDQSVHFSGARTTAPRSPTSHYA